MSLKADGKYEMRILRAIVSIRLDNGRRRCKRDRYYALLGIDTKELLSTDGVGPQDRQPLPETLERLGLGHLARFTGSTFNLFGGGETLGRSS